MEKVKKYIITFYYPGLMVSDTETREQTVPIDPLCVVWPDSAYAFRLSERLDIVDSDTIYKGELEDGKTYYHPDSKLETLEQVRRNPKATQILVDNMIGNKWEAIIWSRWGNYPQPFYPETCEIISK